MRNALTRRVALVSLVLVILGSGWFFLGGRGNQESRDVRKLADASAPWAEQAQALLRLSINQSPEALDFIRKKLGSTQDRLAPWTTRALGYFTSAEAVELLRRQLGSDVPAVREAAIEALAMRRSPDKLQLLSEAKAHAKGDLENARLQLVSLRLAAGTEAKSALAQQVIRELERKSLDPAARELLLGQIFFQSPRTREVESYFSRLSSRIGALDETAGVAVIRALKIYCPANRFDIIRGALAGTSLSATGRARVLNELVFHAGPESREILESAGKDVAPAFVENIRKRLGDPTMKSPCSPNSPGTSAESPPSPSKS